MTFALILFCCEINAKETNISIDNYLPNVKNWMQAKLYNKRPILEALQTPKMNSNENMFSNVLGKQSEISPQIYAQCNNFYIKHFTYEVAKPSISYGLENSEFDILPDQEPYIAFFILNECGDEFVTHVSGYIVDVQIQSKKISSSRAVFHEMDMKGFSADTISQFTDKLYQIRKNISPGEAEELDISGDLEKIKNQFMNSSQ